MSLDEDLAAADAMLKELRLDVLTICARAGFDGEGEAMDKMLESVRLIVAKTRLTLLHAKEQIG